MTKFVKKFKTEADYQAYASSEDYLEPHVSKVAVGSIPHYNKGPWDLDPVTVAELISMGYAYVVTGSSGDLIVIRQNCPYPMSKISDFVEVLTNTKKLTEGRNNTFSFFSADGSDAKSLPQWWSIQDIVDVYSANTINAAIPGGIFYGLDMSKVEDFTLNTIGTSYYYVAYPWGNLGGDNGIFQPRHRNDGAYGNATFKTPKNVTVNFSDTYGTVAQTMFTQMTTTETLTVNVTGGSFFTCKDMSGMFEGCYNLETLNMNCLWRIDAYTNEDTYNGDLYYGCMFRNCQKLKTVPCVEGWGRTSSYNTFRLNNGTYEMFNGCTSLESIRPTLNMRFFDPTAMTSPMFYCPNLTDVRLKCLNSGDWDFTNQSGYSYIPKMDLDSIKYAIDNLVDCSSSPHTIKFGNAAANLPDSYITSASAKGWTVQSTAFNS